MTGNLLRNFCPWAHTVGTGTGTANCSGWIAVFLHLYSTFSVQRLGASDPGIKLETPEASMKLQGSLCLCCCHLTPQDSPQHKLHRGACIKKPHRIPSIRKVIFYIHDARHSSLIISGTSLIHLVFGALVSMHFSSLICQKQPSQSALIKHGSLNPQP